MPYAFSTSYRVAAHHTFSPGQARSLHLRAAAYRGTGGTGNGGRWGRRQQRRRQQQQEQQQQGQQQQNALQRIERAVLRLQGQMENLQGLQDQVGQLGDRVGQLGDRVGQLGDRVGQVEDRVGQLGDRVGQLGDRVGQVEDRVGQLGDRVGQLGDRVGQLGDRVGQVEDGVGQLQGVPGQLTQLQGQMNKLEAQLDKVQEAQGFQFEALVRQAIGRSGGPSQRTAPYVAAAADLQDLVALPGYPPSLDGLEKALLSGHFGYKAVVKVAAVRAANDERRGQLPEGAAAIMAALQSMEAQGGAGAGLAEQANLWARLVRLIGSGSYRGIWLALSKAMLQYCQAGASADSVAMRAAIVKPHRTGTHGELELALVMLVAAAAGVLRRDIGLDILPKLSLTSASQLQLQLTLELFEVKGSSTGIRKARKQLQQMASVLVAALHSCNPGLMAVHRLHVIGTIVVPSDGQRALRGGLGGRTVDVSCPWLAPQSKESMELQLRVL